MVHNSSDSDFCAPLMSVMVTMRCLPVALACFLACCTGPVNTLQWVSPNANTSLIQTCLRSNLTFPWIFALDAGEQLEDIKWLHAPAGGSGTPDLIANFILGHFLVMPRFTGRLQNAGNGDITLTHVTVMDAGTYTVEVVTKQNGSGYSSNRQHAVVEVLDPPHIDNLVMSQVQPSVYDNVTSQWHLQLKCGTFRSFGTPPIDVIWTTPSGAKLSSSYHNNDSFFLALPNPLEGGNYTCRLAPGSSTGLCPHTNTSQPQEASQLVDAWEARLTLLEAKQEALNQWNKLLMDSLTQTKNKLAETDSVLNLTRQALNSTLGDLVNATRELTIANNLVKGFRAELQNVKEDVNNLKTCCGMNSAGHSHVTTPVVTQGASSSQPNDINNGVSGVMKDFNGSNEGAGVTRQSGVYLSSAQNNYVDQSDNMSTKPDLNQESTTSEKKLAVITAVNEGTTRNNKITAIKEDRHGTSAAASSTTRTFQSVKTSLPVTTKRAHISTTQASTRQNEQRITTGDWSTSARVTTKKDSMGDCRCDVTQGATRELSSMRKELTDARRYLNLTRQQLTNVTQLLADTKLDMELTVLNLTDHIQDMEASLHQYQAMINKRITFHAQAAYHQYNNNDHILFDGEVFTNEGNAFNASSGEFTVPVNGIYVLLASTSPYGVQGSSCNADLMVDDTTVARVLGKYSGSYNQVTGHAVLRLRRGQRVWVRSIGVTAIDSRSIFTGFLLKADPRN